MKVVESILTNNACYKAGKKITVKGLMLHSVGCNQPSAMVFVNKWNSTSFTRQVCVHGFIDANDGTVYQTLPWNHRGWHSGSGNKGNGNNTHIGVEMCEPNCIKYTGGSSFTCTNKTKAQEMVKRTYDSAVELFAYLCKEYNLDPLADGVIISHREGHARGIASNHGDPEHLWKGVGLPYTMNTFRNDVKAILTASEASPDTNTPVTTKTDSEAIWKYLKGWLGNDYAVAGVMGNLEAESSLKPTNLQNTYNTKFGLTDEEYTQQIDSGSRSFEDSAGYGLAQWTYYTRKRNLLKFAKEQGKSVGDLTLQLDFLQKEMTEGYNALVKALKGSVSVSEASDMVLTIYEKPAKQDESVKNKRCSLGQAWFDKYSFKPFLVKVLVSDLRIRTEPSLNGTVKGYTGKGTFTIIEVNGDWGKLKSGAGWIFISNPKYCTIIK